MDNPLDPHHLSNRSFTDMLICLVWHLPLPQQYAIDTENTIIDLEKKNLLYTDDNINNIIYNIIHYNDPYENINIFIDKLNVDDAYKEIIMNDIHSIDIYNMMDLVGIINRYIALIDIISSVFLDFLYNFSYFFYALFL
jgi:hypothetical protein